MQMNHANKYKYEIYIFILDIWLIVYLYTFFYIYTNFYCFVP